MLEQKYNELKQNEKKHTDLIRSLKEEQARADLNDEFNNSLRDRLAKLTDELQKVPGGSS